MHGKEEEVMMGGGGAEMDTRETEGSKTERSCCLLGPSEHRQFKYISPFLQALRTLAVLFFRVSRQGGLPLF